jgi:hypothetical protein
MNAPDPIPFEEYRQQQARRNSQFQAMSLAEVMAMAFEPVRWAVPGYVPEGLSILAGRQKTGKTWMALDFAIAIAMGGATFGAVSCEQGDVLYCDLENGPRRVQSRVGMLAPGTSGQEWLARITIVSKCPRLDKGLLQELENWRRSVPRPRLIVIDVFQKVRPPSRQGVNSYQADYDSISQLQQWATEYHIAVLLLHHLRKGGADDPLEALNGSNGLSACADTTLVLDRKAGACTLYVRGRDVEEQETAIRFDDGLWTIIGEAGEVRRSDQRNAILIELQDAAEPLTPKDLAIATGLARNNVDQLLHNMAKAGEVIRVGRGQYAHPDRAEPGELRQRDKNDKKIRNASPAKPYKDWE